MDQKENSIPVSVAESAGSSTTYPVDREMAQPLFARFFEKYEIDPYGNPDTGTPLAKTAHSEGETFFSIDTDIFRIHPYYWGGDEAAQKASNFLYKPEGVEIWWYKYCIRSACSNVPLTKEKVQEMLERCGESADALAATKENACNDKKAVLRSIAKKLDGMKYLEERKEVWKEAEKEGIAIVYGYSDDCIDFFGAINDELGCFDGGRVMIPGSNGKYIDALWYGMLDGTLAAEPIEYTLPDGNLIAWTYRTGVPHETFTVYEDGMPYCRGIVFFVDDCR